MAYASLTNKLLMVEDDLRMRMVLKKFLGIAVEGEVCSERENAPAFTRADDIPDRIITNLNTPQVSGS